MRPVVLRARAMPVMTRAQAADAAARQQHETLGGLIAQLRQLERDVGSEAYVVYYTSRADAACLVLQGPAKFYSPYRPPYVAVLEQRRTIDDHRLNELLLKCAKKSTPSIISVTCIIIQPYFV